MLNLHLHELKFHTRRYSRYLTYKWKKEKSYSPILNKYNNFHFIPEGKLEQLKNENKNGFDPVFWMKQFCVVLQGKNSLQIYK